MPSSCVLEDTLKLRTDTVQLQRDRFEGGIIGEYDLRIAEAERSAVVADIARTQAGDRPARGGHRHAHRPLAARGVHAGGRARRVDRRRHRSAGAARRACRPACIERRPDIRRSEALMAASDLRIQQARANYFPSLTLTGAYGFESAAMASLFSGPGGDLEYRPRPRAAAVRAEGHRGAGRTGHSARNDQTLVEYQQTVQFAFREVHDALVANRAARDVLAAETDRRDQIAKAYEVALLRYDAGRTSFLEVIDAQRQLLAAETLRIGRRARRQAVDRRFREVAGRRLESGAVRRRALLAAKAAPRPKAAPGPKPAQVQSPSRAGAFAPGAPAQDGGEQ